MLVLLSPAKTLDFESPDVFENHTAPRFPREAQQLIEHLRTLSPQDICELMHLSGKLGQLNYDRYQRWQPLPQQTTQQNALQIAQQNTLQNLPQDTLQNNAPQPAKGERQTTAALKTTAAPTTVAALPSNPARQAIFAFKGDVYAGLRADTFSDADLRYSQMHLRILSGLYGLLRPLDLIQPYRLEMGTRLATQNAKDLYGFWRERITQLLLDELHGTKNPVLVNLASQEYFKAVNTQPLLDVHADIISPVFLDQKNGVYKIISFFAKQARGMMAAFIIKNRLAQPLQLRDFAEAGYRYDPSRSTPSTPTFIRDSAPTLVS